MSIIIGLTGLPGSGKNTAARHLVDHHGFVEVAFADPIRQAAMVLNPYVDSFYTLEDVVNTWGWDEAKNKWPEVRRVLQVLGTELGRDLHGAYCWIDKVWEKIDSFPDGQDVVITDCRFHDEARSVWLRGGYIVRLRRKSRIDKKILSHRSEIESQQLISDWEISNESSKDELAKRVDRLVSNLSKKRSNL